MIRVAASEVVASCIARMTPVVDVVSWVGTVRPVRCRLAQNLTPQLCDVRHVRRMLAMLRKCGLSQCSAGQELHRHPHPVGQPGEEVLKPVGWPYSTRTLSNRARSCNRCISRRHAAWAYLQHAQPPTDLTHATQLGRDDLGPTASN